MVKKSSLPEPVSDDTPAPSAIGDGVHTVVSAEPKAVLTSPVKPETASQRESKSKPAPARSKSLRLYNWAFWILLIVMVVTGFLALEKLGDRFDQIRQEAAARSDALAAALQTAERDAAEALALARSQAATMTQLQGALAQTQSRYQALAARTPASADGDEAMRVNEVEHLIRQASQQLRLGGQVGNAIIALEIARSRLIPDDGSAERTERPEQVLLRQVLEDDLARLRATPVVDVAARVAQVERLIALTARAPLLASDVAFDAASDDAASNAVAAASGTPPDAPAQGETQLDADADLAVPWWQRASHSVAAWGARSLSGLGRDLRGLVSIQRVADPDALLLAPDQAVQLRATLRMQLLAAQVALLMGQTSVWQNELASVNAALSTYYDAHAPETAAAVQLARELGEAAVAVTVPDVAASLKAAAVLRAAHAYVPGGAANRAPAATSGSED